MNYSGKSILGYEWKQSEHDTRLAFTIAQKLEKSHTLSKLLAHRQLALEEIENFLTPTIKHSLPDPFLLLDMNQAVEKIIWAIKNHKKIVVFGDYDVDGATSSALLKRFFKMCGSDADIYIPDRILEGYGPNVEALLNLKKSGADLVITVDCGTVAFEPLEAAHNAGLEVIVIDHHLGALDKPKAIAVINPNRLDENFPHKNLAAVGVCFLLCVAVNKILKINNFYQQNNLAEPKLFSLLDLVALGTVCDVVPLTGVNRALVAQGLKVMKARENIGIRNLSDIANLDEEPNAYHLGFILGPRINAGGRVGKSDLGARLLSSENNDEAKEIASLLNSYNSQRKDIEKNVLLEAMQMAEQENNSSAVIILASNNWHPGVIGIVASRIKELYNKPTAIIALDNAIGKASCRSISGIDFGSAIVKAKLNGILVAGGGHAMAAGFTIHEDKISDLRKFLNDELADLINFHNQNKIRQFHDILDINSANLNLAKEILLLEPYGSGNSKPKFLIKDLLITKADIVGADGKHVSCIFSGKNLAGLQGRIQGIAFGAMENALGEILISKNNSQNINVIGQINVNSWMGNEKLQLMIEDILI